MIIAIHTSVLTSTVSLYIPDTEEFQCTEVSSFQGVEIEEFYCIQKCPHFRGLK